MRSVQLAKVAAQAEKLRLQRLARRQAFRVVYAIIAAVFGIGALAWIEVVIWFALRNAIEPLQASLVLFGINLLPMAVLLGLAAHSAPDRIEREAETVKTDALAEMREAVIVLP